MVFGVKRGSRKFPVWEVRYRDRLLFQIIQINLTGMNYIYILINNSTHKGKWLFTRQPIPIKHWNLLECVYTDKISLSKTFF